MALGGIYDQLGGGFARYTTDALWHIPHFEKMLYDNGQLISLYAHAYQATKNEFYNKILSETIQFVKKDLAAPNGGYFSSVDADSQSEEGKYYAWSEQDFLNATGGSEMLSAYFNVSSSGNWGEGANIFMLIKRRKNLPKKNKFNLLFLSPNLLQQKAVC